MAPEPAAAKRVTTAKKTTASGEGGGYEARAAATALKATIKPMRSLNKERYWSISPYWMTQACDRNHQPRK